MVEIRTVAGSVLCWAVGETGGPRRPGVLLLHGRGGDARDLPAALPGITGPLVVAARAPLPYRTGGFAWYPVIGDGQPEPDGYRQALEALRQCVTDLPRHLPIDPARMAVIGFSQGASLAAALALCTTVPVAAVGVLSGYLPPFAERTATTSTGAAFVGHGDQDRSVPTRRGHQVAALLAASGRTVTAKTYPMGHGITPAEAADVAAWVDSALGLR